MENDNRCLFCYAANEVFASPSKLPNPFQEDGKLPPQRAPLHRGPMTAMFKEAHRPAHTAEPRVGKAKAPHPTRMSQAIALQLNERRQLVQRFFGKKIALNSILGIVLQDIQWKSTVIQIFFSNTHLCNIYT